MLHTLEWMIIARRETYVWEMECAIKGYRCEGTVFCWGPQTALNRLIVLHAAIILARSNSALFAIA